MSVCVHVRVHVRVCVLSLHISLFPQQVAKLLSVSPEKANPRLPTLYVCVVRLCELLVQ